MVPFLYFFYAHPGGVAPYSATDLHTMLPTRRVCSSLCRPRCGTPSYHGPVWSFGEPPCPLPSRPRCNHCRYRLASILPGPAVRVGFGRFCWLPGAADLAPAHRGATTPEAQSTGRDHHGRRGWFAFRTDGHWRWRNGVGADDSVPGAGPETGRRDLTGDCWLCGHCGFGHLGSARLGSGRGMPPGSLGYVHVLAGVPILIGSVMTVKSGTS